MELTTLSPSHTHRHHTPTAGEEDQDRSLTAAPAPLSTSPRSKSKIHEATSRVKAWWSNNIRLVVVIHSSAEPVPTSAEGQGQDQAQAQDYTQAQDQFQAQDQIQAQGPAQVQDQSQTQHQDPNQTQPKPNDAPAKENAQPSKTTDLPPTPSTEQEPQVPIPLDHRDFLALERTFLSYLRTSTALVTFGVLVTQLFVLKKLNPTIGMAVGAVCEAGGMLIVVLGCVRYFRQQRLLVQRKTVVAGWDLLVVWGVLGGVLVGILVVVLVQR